ncbi:glycoside hydrolase [Schizophyllum commune Tattone D]|nr:glycoside hydrolase [Schizophyllum commune Tattone D]
MANFDGHNGSYPAEYLPQGTLTDASINYTLPVFTNPDPAVLDNINCTGQTIEVPRGQYHSFNFLGATDGIAYVNGEFFAVYDDNSTESLGFVVAPWWLKNPSDGPITAPYLNEGLANGTTHKNYNITRMFTFQHHVDNSKVLTSLILPNQTASSQLTGTVSIHVFAITLISESDVTADAPVLEVQNVRSTTKFRTLPSSSSSTLPSTTTEAQLIELTLANLAPSTAGPEAWLTSPLTLSLESDDIETVLPATIVRLRGGDQAKVVVGVVNKKGVEAGAKGRVRVVATLAIESAKKDERAALSRNERAAFARDEKVLADARATRDEKVALASDREWDIVAGIPDYYVGDESLSMHESAEWFDDAKFGLFVHWGIYSVPAWTVSGTQYAEWYWYWQHNPANASSAVWTHHRETYGEDFFYDDFFPMFTADAFDAEEFVGFVADVGAKYFVITTKHHDGFALFDTGASSNRNSLNYGPKRDLIAEIMLAANNTQPQLHRGLYYSLPEWFNPSFAKYGHAGGGDDLYHRRSSDPDSPGYNILQRTGFAGGLAANAYNASAPPEPYTGYVEVDDFLQDIMKPQMEALFYQYETDILWCDVGGPTVLPDIAPEWFNRAKQEGRQVVANVRCGANYSDFDNPEYSATSHLKLRKWESSEGSDPYSYGYNRDTPYEDYRNATYILHSLVDIVSKNGNYLIDIGPTANGTVVPPSRSSLLKVGEWLKIGGDAIYGTKYWYVAAEDGDLRFTTKDDAFYILSLAYPEGGVVSTKLPLPLKEGDKAAFLGRDTTDKKLDWKWTDDGVFELYADEDDLKQVDDVWAFKVAYA